MGFNEKTQQFDISLIPDTAKAANIQYNKQNYQKYLQLATKLIGTFPFFFFNSNMANFFHIRNSQLKVKNFLFGLNLLASHTFKFIQLSISPIEQCSHYGKILAQISNLCFYSLLTNWENRIKLLHNQRHNDKNQHDKATLNENQKIAEAHFSFEFFVCNNKSWVWSCLYVHLIFFKEKKSHRIDWDWTI